MMSPASVMAGHVLWDSLRTGALSPSMLVKPAYMYDDGNPGSTSSPSWPAALSSDPFSPSAGKLKQSPLSQSSLTSPQPIQNDTLQHKSDCIARESSKRKLDTRNDKDDASKRRNFLERNRLAALKCRQRKKQWLQNLQIKVECLQHDNEQLYLHTEALRKELVHLKTMLLHHKACPVNQSATLETIDRPLPGACTILPSDALSRLSERSINQRQANRNRSIP
ncbi:hypothetical protein EC973_001347 [Apophysomyces ossiformis]|uniref:BZIP domain-containing protein n=1 Tax=Apophysomyces ossiformis TaxID=679940 RepID=A0A8H7BYI2_9FUNG|nr:hypothetical protein EC973_001347 [Apophysomyces ossiformis]